MPLRLGTTSLEHFGGPISLGELGGGGEFDPVAASGFFTFGANPTAGDPMPALNGIATIIFHEGASQFPQVRIQEGDLTGTLSLLVAGLEDAKSAPGYEALVGYTYTTDGVDKLIITADVAGSAGNGYTLGASTVNIVRSAATLQGGVG